MRELVVLRSGVHGVVTPRGRRLLAAWPHAQDIGPRTAAQDAALRRLASGPLDPHDLDDELLDRLRSGGWLATTVVDNGHPIYTIMPLTPPPPRPFDDGELVLSRFAVMRQGDWGLVIESPRSWCEIRVHDASVVAALLESTVDGRMRLDLAWAGVLVPAGSEDDELRLSQWGPHELWFHHRSRGVPGDRTGATYWAHGRFEPLPVRPPEYPGPVVELAKPGSDRKDPSLTEVLETRRSIRVHDDDHPITAGELGELLYRCGRTDSVHHDGYQELAARPYPNGGAAGELELYPVIRHAAGVAPGMYHYDSHDHVLRLVRSSTDPAVRRLLIAAARGTGAAEPQVLIVVAARFGRLMWKYEAIPYSAILKHVGVLFQTMYLVATAMGLAPCAVGAGDSQAFAEATGRDPLVENSVGEFMLGRPA
ncbi:hypothetical protein Lesp02_31920 [Lentzea sp. NBRC 105346]|uniref:SagB family peptide dehydrogenase n=1 Tax=Lentzea sp. NBRC 105346 TaxID=3032205 RepID=UPI0024A427D2|nr:SagB family peptide dehydrogenase [Lentzea sp. NBRC 105346]GLZ31003.1 hypothetical protein Lesp02_31920 [Lentzea sp. NBRC 105346]